MDTPHFSLEPLKPGMSRRRRTLKKKKTFKDQFLVWLFFLVFFSYLFVILFGHWALLPSDKSQWCRAYQRFPKSYENPDFNNDPCYMERTPLLLGMNLFECDFSQRMTYSVLMGGIIGFERKSTDRPAGVRTMSLVSLGSCFFTMVGQMGFRSSTMGWDAARVSAAIPSGVGFLGAGLVWKGSATLANGGARHQVRGLTTAASVWLSAAVGVGVGGQLYVISTYTVILVVFVLRLGPRMAFSRDKDDGSTTASSTTGTGSSDLESMHNTPLTRHEQRKMLEEESAKKATTAKANESSLFYQQQNMEKRRGGATLGSVSGGGLTVEHLRDTRNNRRRAKIGKSKSIPSYLN